MASIRQSIRSSTASKRPTSAIADGQIALNTASGTPGMFFKDSAGNIIKTGPAHYGASAPNSSPAVGGSTGNSIGEAWLDSSLTPAGWKIWSGSAWVNATPLSSDTVQGLVELATNAETQAGADTARAVTSAGLQSKVSDSISTASSSGIASSSAVKTAYDLANAALPKSGGIITGNLEIGSTGSLTFEGSTADGFETTLAVVDPTLDRTITFPNITGTVVTTGDTGTVTSTMILDGTILNADVNASAAIAGTKISPDFGAQTIVTTGVHSAAAGSAAAPSMTFTGDLNTGIYSPGADQVAISTNSSQKFLIDSTGNVTFTGGGISNNTAAGVSGNLLFNQSGIGLAQIGMPASENALTFKTWTGASLAERLRITAGGLVGVGTSSPTDTNGYGTTLDIRGSGTGNGGVVYLGNSDATVRGQLAVYGDGRMDFGTTTNHPLKFYTFNAERVRIDSSGRLGVGTTSPGGQLDCYTTSYQRLLVTYPSTYLTKLQLGSFGYIQSDAGTDAYTIDAGTSSSANIRFNTYTGERARIDSSGRFGIGTSGPTAILHTVSAESGILGANISGNIYIESNTTAAAGVGGGIVFGGAQSGTVTTVAAGIKAAKSNGTAGDYGFDLAFYTRENLTAGAERMRISSVGTTTLTSAASTAPFIAKISSTEAARIDSSGRLLVGTSTTSEGSAAIFQGYDGVTTNPGVVRICKGAATPASGDALGYLTFGDSTHKTCGAIQGERDGGTWSASSKPTRLVFSTTADGAASPTERMRIGQNGQSLFRTNANNNNPTIAAYSDATSGFSDAIVDVVFTVSSPNNATANFAQFRDTTIVRAAIRSNGGLANYQANDVNLSDRNAKKDISPAADTWECIKDWEIVNYRYKDQPDDADLNLGVIAQQVAESCPEVITVFEEAKDDQPEKLGVKEQQMYWMAIKALQEAQVRIEQLEQRLTDAGIA